MDLARHRHQFAVGISIVLRVGTVELRSPELHDEVALAVVSCTSWWMSAYSMSSRRYRIAFMLAARVFGGFFVTPTEPMDA